MSSAYFVELENRGAVRVAGPDRRAFLQGLITNDITLLDRQPCVYACLLTPQGKFLHDFFITEQADTIQIECEGAARAKDLAARLKTFKLRSSIAIESIESLSVFNIIDDGDKNGSPDPRHPSLGTRSYVRPSLPERPFDDWDARRIRLAVPDGSRDFEVGVSTPEDGHLDRLNGVSYAKGCYMGQELTARIHYRGLAKRHLYAVEPLNTAALPAPGDDIRAGDALLGQMRSSCGEIGLALLKDDALENLSGAGLKLAMEMARP